MPKAKNTGLGNRLGFYFWSIFKIWKVLWNNKWLWGIPGEDTLCPRRDHRMCVTWTSSGRALPPTLCPLAGIQSLLLSAIVQFPLCMTGTGAFFLVWTKVPQDVRELLGSWDEHPSGGGGLGARRQQHRRFAWVWPEAKLLKPAWAGENTSIL